MPEVMTKKDAIEYLLYMKHDVQAKSPMDIALDTAIEALKQPTIEPEKSGEYLVEFRVQLKKAMEKRNITQSQLCERTGIPKSAMSQYLSGAFRPKQERVYILAKALRTTPEYLMGFTDDIKIPQSPAVNRWIPCSERLPELNEVNQSECVLVCALNDNWIGMAYFLGNGWAFADAQTKPRLDVVEVTHWMPLPEPPEKE